MAKIEKKIQAKDMALNRPQKYDALEKGVSDEAKKQFKHKPYTVVDCLEKYGVDVKGAIG